MRARNWEIFPISSENALPPVIKIFFRIAYIKTKILPYGTSCAFFNTAEDDVGITVSIGTTGGGDYRTDVQASGGLEELYSFWRWLSSWGRPQMSHGFKHNFDQWNANIKDAAARVDEVFRNAQAIYAQKPASIEGVPAYEERRHVALQEEQDANEALIRATEELVNKTDDKQLKRYYRKRKFDRVTREELEKLHAKTVERLQNRLYPQRDTLARLCTESRMDKICAEMVIEFNAWFEEYARECNRI